MSNRPVKQVVVLVKATVANSIASYQHKFYGTLTNADTVSLKVGDQVAWNVTVSENSVNSVRPYTISFSDPSIFGTASITVPSGGFSPYLQVVSLPRPRPSKYTITILGLSPVDDPLIQVDADSFLAISADRTPDVYVVTWSEPDGAHPHGVIQYTKNGGAPQDFPLPTIVGDKVTFQVNAADLFDVLFTGDDHSVGTPFSEIPPDSNVVPGTVQTGGMTSTAQVTVATDPDPDPNFPFFIRLRTDSSKFSDTVVLSVSNPRH